MKRALYFICVFYFLLFSGCDRNKNKDLVTGFFLYNGIDNQFAEGSIEITGDLHSITLRTLGNGSMLIEFEGKGVKSHVFGSNIYPRITFFTAEGNLYESTDGFLEIGTYIDNEKKLEIKGILNFRAINNTTTTIGDFSNGNFSLTRFY